MKVEIKSDSNLKFYGKYNLEKVNAESDLSFEVFFKTLTIKKDKELVCRFINVQLFEETFSSKLILYSVSQRLKTIIVEVVGDKDQMSKIKSLLLKHNLLFSYREPLALDFSKESRESLLSTEKEANLRGFMHLFIIYSTLNYGRLVMENLRNNSSVFLDTVS